LRETLEGEERRFTVAQGARFSAIYQPMIACAWRAVSTGSDAFLLGPLEPSAGGLLFLERDIGLRERFVAGVRELCARATANLPLRTLLDAAGTKQRRKYCCVRYFTHSICPPQVQVLHAAVAA
jgi:hypothetical protein